eukprot:5872541-Heterocapsa_arctica.AAC.1
MAPFSEGGASGSAGEGRHAGDEGEVKEEEAEEEEGRAPVLGKGPVTPTKQEIEEHMATHIPL